MGPFFDLFGPITGTKIKIKKKIIKSPLENIILHLCIKNHDIWMFYLGDNVGDGRMDRWMDGRMDTQCDILRWVPHLIIDFESFY